MKKLLTLVSNNQYTNHDIYYAKVNIIFFFLAIFKKMYNNNDKY